MKTFLMLHGINHNMFGKRDPVQYGTATLADIDTRLRALGEELGVVVESYQTTARRICVYVSTSLTVSQNVYNKNSLVLFMRSDERERSV
jgi:3-dehydroquinate dehydratase